MIFRDSLSRLTEDWLLLFGLLFVAFVVFSPTGLVGMVERLTARWRPRPSGDAAMANRATGAVELPAFLKPDHAGAVADHRGRRPGQELRRHPRGTTAWRCASGTAACMR